MNKKLLKAIAAITASVVCLTLYIPIALAKSKVPVVPSDVKVAAVSYTTVRISWEKVDGAAGYDVYRATTLKGSYRRIARITGTSYANKKLSSNKTYYYKIRAYTKSHNKKIYGKYSGKVKVTTPKDLMAYYRSIQGSSLNKVKLKKLDAKADSIIKEILIDGMSEVEKANAIYNYILDNVSYENRGWQVNNANHAYGALINGKAQCSGYSRAMVLLCAKAGIECLYVLHKNPFQFGHKWNMIKISERYYHLEVQGNDLDHDNPSPWSDMDIVEDITFHLMGDSNMDKETYKWDKKKYPKCPSRYRQTNPPVEG
jgi:hypothetical protein